MRLVLTCLLCALAAAPNIRAADAHSATNPAALGLKKFQLAPGLKAELVAAEPLLQNPVAFSIDGHGRFFVAETHRWNLSIFDITANTPWLLDDLSCRTVNDRAAFLARVFATNYSVLTNQSELIRLVEDRDGDHQAETSSVFAEDFRESVSGTAAGVLAQGTNVWFTSIPDLRQFTHHPTPITNGPGTTRDASSMRLASGLGVHISVSGHDVHGLIRGHDGRIYFSFGDRGVCVTNREGVVLNVPDTGGVLRCEPDGRNLEIFCTGLRNPQELAFDDYGNLWTVDNDTAGADPCRVLHLIEGGDYGWRMSYQHMKGFGPWVQEELWRGGLDGILPPAGTVSQGPAGLAFYPGTSATPQLAGKFVHADFPGGVWAYSVKPRGASYEVAGKEKILWDCWPTDVDFGPDGALYVLDWVQGWGPPGKGRIYRLTDGKELGARNAEQVAEVQRRLGEGMANRSEKDLLALLGHADRRVRLEAQWELAGRGTNSLKALVTTVEASTSRMARIHAAWAIEQIARPSPLTSAPDVVTDALYQILPFVTDKDAAFALCLAQTMAEAQCLELDSLLRKWLKDDDAAIRFRAITSHGTLPWGRMVRTRPKFLEKLATRINRPMAWKALNILQPGRNEFDGIREGELIASLREQATDPFLLQALTRAIASGVPFGTGIWVLDGAPTNQSVVLRLSAVQARRRLMEWWRAHPEYPGYPHLPTLMPIVEPPVREFLYDRSQRVVLEAVRAINDSPMPSALPALAALLEDQRFHDANWGESALLNITPAGPFSANVRAPREQVLRRALNAHFRLGTATNAEALVRFALRTPASDPARPKSGPDRANSETGAPPHLRSEALFLLGAWEVLPAKVGDLPIKPTKDPNHGSVPTVNPENWPGWFDRVVGLWRPLPPRPPEDARHALAPHIASLLSDNSSEVAQAALDAATKLRLTNAIPTLMARLPNPATPPSFRRQIPTALAAMAAADLADAVKLALADQDLEVRAAALPFLDRLPGGDAPTILGNIVAEGIKAPASNAAPSQNQDGLPRTGALRSESALRLAQAALAALGGLRSSAASDILRPALTNLLSGTLPPGLVLDVLDAAALRNDPEIKSLLARREAALPKDDALSGWRPVLAGGDREQGRKLFFEKVEVQCSRCHSIKGEGGTVGPALDGVGKQRSREHLLESIVFPNRAIAPGFESVFLVLKSGTEHTGLVKSEDEKELRLESPEEGPLRIARSEIVSRQRSLSAMPDAMGQLLTKREVRDLVEYLAGLR